MATIAQLYEKTSALSAGHSALTKTSQEALESEHNTIIRDLVKRRDTMSVDDQLDHKDLELIMKQNTNMSIACRELQAIQSIASDSLRRSLICGKMEALRRGEVIDNPFHQPSGVFGNQDICLCNFTLDSDEDYKVNTVPPVIAMLFWGCKSIRLDVKGENTQAGIVRYDAACQDDMRDIITQIISRKEGAHDLELLLDQYRDVNQHRRSKVASVESSRAHHTGLQTVGAANATPPSKGPGERGLMCDFEVPAHIVLASEHHEHSLKSP